MSELIATKKKSFGVHPLYVLLFLVPFIDVLNGIIQTELSISFSIGLVYRILTLAVCLLYLLVNRFSSFFSVPIVFMLYLFASIPFHVEANLIDDIRDAVTISTLPLMYLSIRMANSKKTTINLHRLINWYCLAFPLTLVIPYILKIGYSSYGDSGYKGFYIALNAISNTIVITSIISIYKLFKKQNIYNILIFALNTFCILIMGTKSSYLLYAISLLVFSIMFLFSKHNKLSKKVLFVGLVAVGIVVFVSLFKEQILSIFDRWEYFFNQRSFVSFITSARSERIAPAFNFIKSSEFSAFYLLFGYGNIVNESLEYSLIEMDFIDMFLAHGLIGFLLFLAVILELIVNVRAKSFINKYILVVFLLLSFFVGHVVTNALSVTLLAIVISCPDRMRIVKVKSKKQNISYKRIVRVSMFD